MGNLSVNKNNKNLMPKVVISILNWNGWKDTLECLESLYQIDYSNYDIILVDNGSKDDSIKKIKNYCHGKIEVKSGFFKYDKRNKPINIEEYTKEENVVVSKAENFKDIPSNKKITILKNEKNYGFAEGNNIAVRYAIKTLHPQYILFLNNDTIVDKFFLKELIAVAENDKKIGILGPKIYFYDFYGRTDVIECAGIDMIPWNTKEIRYGFKEVDAGQHDEIKEFSRLDGSCMLIRNIGDLVFFHPEFFAYWEEIDLCFKFKKNGYKIVYVPKAKIWHKKFASGRKKISFSSIYYMTRNRFLFVKRNIPENDQLKFLIYFFGLDIWKWFYIFLRDGGAKSLSPFYKGLIDGIKFFIK